MEGLSNEKVKQNLKKKMRNSREKWDKIAHKSKRKLTKLDESTNKEQRKRKVKLRNFKKINLKKPMNKKGNWSKKILHVF